MLDRNSHGLLRQAVERLLELLLDVGKHRGVSRVRSNLLEDQIERVLRASSMGKRISIRDRLNPLKRRGSDGIRMASQVDERRPSPVAASAKIDLLVAESSANLVEVIDRVVGRVLLQVGAPLQSRKGRPKSLWLEVVLEVSLQIIVASRHRDMKPVGASRPALIDEDDVPLLSNPPVHLCAKELRGRSAGTSVQDEDRVGRRISAASGQNYRADPNLASLPRLAILGHRKEALNDDALRSLVLDTFEIEPRIHVRDRAADSRSTARAIASRPAPDSPARRTRIVRARSRKR